ncbi:MAG TPA: hypothetical protein VJR67_03065 [Candidatus Nitrosopolaris sp.]|nr:hypothetical protein [Candidatus Nitrosopolaris sp.]
MNHKYVILGIATVIAAVAVNAVGFALPQQALAHYSHHHHNNNGIKVDQVINQANFCNQSLCANNANNNVDIDR